MKERLKKIKNNPWILWIWNEQRRIKGEQNFKKYTDEQFIKQFYKNSFEKELNLDNPVSFNEKINWLKLNMKNSNATICADKYKVRQFIQEKGYGDILNDLIEVYDNVDDIDLDKLPEKFVMKATHGSGWNLIVKDKKQVNWTAWKLIMKSWLNQNFYYYGREIVYKDIKPRIICEKFLEDENGNLLDYKFLCFNGKPKLIQVDVDRFEKHSRNIYDLNWNLTPIQILYKNSDKIVKKPKNFELMIKICEDIAKEFDHVRVDFYEVNGKLYFGELTFFHESGTGKFNPIEYDEILGNWLDLSRENCI